MEVLFEGWSWYDRIVLDPQGVSVVNKEDGTTTTVGRLELVKGWRNSYGARLGGSFRWLEPGPARPGVELHAGLAGETNAVPLERQAIDAVGGDRLGGSLGATLSWRGLSLTLAAMQYLPVTLDVSGSLVTRTAVEPEPQPTVVGNGTYRASTRVLAVGLGWSGTAF